MKNGWTELVADLLERAADFARTCRPSTSLNPVGHHFSEAPLRAMAARVRAGDVDVSRFPVSRAESAPWTSAMTWADDNGHDLYGVPDLR